MMTQDEFQKKYHYFRTYSEKEAKEEQVKINKEGIENDKAVAIKLDELGWCLMLESAAIFAETVKIIPPQKKERIEKINEQRE